MSYNSINEYYEKSLIPQVNVAIEKCAKECLKYVDAIKQNAENDLARIERGEAITEWVRG